MFESRAGVGKIRVTYDDIEFAGRTDVGVRRSHNQDSLTLLPAADAEHWSQRGHVFVVADGMGAHAVGELASKMAADGIPHLYSKHAPEGPAAALRRAFVETNQTIHNRGKQNREFEGMGTTASALVLRPEGAWIGHVGDSRVYRIRERVIEQLSFDHSLVWELARRQKRDPSELTGVPSNVIIRSLGPEPDVQVDLEGPHVLEPGDTFLLCSDGLSGPVSDRELGAVVAALSPDEACRFLIHLANLQGGPDNITAIVVRVAPKRPVLRNGVAEEGGLPPEGAAAPADRPPAWPFILLLGGVLLAMTAVFLSYNRWPGELVAFLFAALCLGGGVFGLILQNSRETGPLPKEDAANPPRIHRRTECPVTPALLDRLAQAIAALKERLRDQKGEVDWPGLDRLLDEARRAIEEEDLASAFRQRCRGMLLLMDAFSRLRTREEAFRPLWDRAEV